MLARPLPAVLVLGALVTAALAGGALVAALPDPLPVVQRAVDDLGDWAYVLVVAVVLLETSVGLGLLSPGEAVLAVAGAAAAGGILDPVLLAVLCGLAGVAGDTTSWWLGRRYGTAALPRIGRRIGLPAARVARVSARVAAGGGWVLVAGRFVGPVRVLAPFLLGAGGMRYRTFLPYDAAGITVWAGTYLTLGWVFADALGSATTTVGRVGLAVLVGATISVALSRRLPRRGARPADPPA